MFNETFLMTFKSFSNVTELFDLLVERFRIEAPEGLTPEEHTVWVEQKQKPIRIRFVYI
jgi:son of sevenless-like protein